MFGRRLPYELADGRRYADRASALAAVMDECLGQAHMLRRLIEYAESKVNHDLTIGDKEREGWYWTARMLRRVEHEDGFVPNGFAEAQRQIKRTTDLDSR